MFTKEELTEIVAAHKAVYEAIKGNFNGGTGQEDEVAAEKAATQIVAAKIIAMRSHK